MSNFEQMLRDGGLDAYVSILKENRIDLDILSQLTSDDMRELGIPLGDRKRILGLAKKITEAREPPPSGSTEGSIEIRQITALFADMVGSTRIAEELDVEDYHAALADFHKNCTAIIRNNGGTPARYIGDAVLACFGFPQASENDANFAMSAALEIVNSLPKVNTGLDVELHARVGIATGIAMTGELLDEGQESFGPATGSTLNLAARLQALAAPDTVFLDQSTRALASSKFNFSWIGEPKLDGFAKPQSVWRLEPKPTHISNDITIVTPLIGREREVDALEQSWLEAKRKGSIVLISGEAGVGKTRTLGEFISQAGISEQRIFRMECIANETLRPFRPVITMLENIAGSDGQSRPKRVREWIVKDMKLSPSTADIIARLVAPGEETADDLTDSPKDRKKQIFETLVLLIERLCLDAPGLFVIEDIHWIDPTTQEFLDHLAERISPMRAMVVCTYRPDHQPNFVGQPRVSLISLSRLDGEQSANLMNHVVGDTALPPDVASEIVARADGVPFFVEELTRSAIEAGSEDGVTDVDRRIRNLPTTLHGSLLARLDRVPGANRIAPIGAAIGRSFPEDMVLKVAGITESEALPILDGLVATGLLIRQGVVGQAEYTFKHALVRDAAYETMPKSRRIAVHQQIASLLETERFDGIVAPEILARHFSEAQMNSKAIECWRAAADHSIDRFANLEATQYIRSALMELENLEPSVDRDLIEIDLRETLMTPLGLTAWGSPAIDENLEMLFRLQQKSGDSSSLFGILAGQCGAQLMAGQINRALDIASQMADFAEPEKRPEEEVLTVHYTAMSLFFLNRLEEAVTMFDREIVIAHPGLLSAINKHYVADPAIVARCMQAWANLFLDNAEEAEIRICEAVEMLAAEGESFSVAYGYGIIAACYQTAGDPVKTVAYAQRALDLSRVAPEKRIPYWEAWSQILLGWGITRQKGDATGLKVLKTGLQDYVGIGAKQILPYGHLLLADALRNMNDSEAAEREVDIARELRSTSDLSVFDVLFDQIAKQPI